ncbi:MAG: thermonuclease family protein [Dehalococcoidia bacterium]
MKASVFAIVLFASPAFADVTVTDGDTIRQHGATFRLHGIDAPEYRQTCADGWPAGIVAASALREMVRDRRVICEPRSTDRYGRTVALCRADGVDIGAEMVRAGWAWAFTRYSHDYARQEDEAWATRVGVHGHDCMPAWDWRALQKRQ